MRFLIDTNVFREIDKTDGHAQVRAWLRTVDDADLAISALTVREVQKGIVRLRKRKPDVAQQVEGRVGVVFDAFHRRILPVSYEVAELWGELLGESERNVDDAGLAATARIQGLVLVTRNLKHFSGRGVATLDPFRARARIKPPLSQS